MLSILRILPSFRGSILARNTGWMLVGLGLKLVIQAAYFTVIARSLGAEHYGAFVGVVGLVGILSPFGTLGSGNLLIKNVARDHLKFQTNLGLALLTTIPVSSVLFFLVVLISRYFLPATIPFSLAILVAASDLFGTSITTICCQAFSAFERLKWTASINALLSAMRLVAASVLITFHHNPSALEWGRFYFGSTSLAAIVALGIVFVKLGPPNSALRVPPPNSGKDFISLLAGVPKRSTTISTKLCSPASAHWRRPVSTGQLTA